MPNHTYLAYLLRLWRDQPHTAWRIMLENPSTGERQYFAGLQELSAFLQPYLEDVEPDVERPFKKPAYKQETDESEAR